MDDAQVAVFGANMDVMRSLGVDIAAHNREYSKKCLRPAKGE